MNRSLSHFILSHQQSHWFQLALGVALGVCVIVNSGLSAQAQVGPEPPHPKMKDPTAEKVKESLKKFFGPQDNSKNAEGEEVGPKPDEPNSNFDKPKANTQTVPFKPDPRRPETWGNDPVRDVPSAREKQPEPEMPKRPPLLTQPPLAGAKIEDPQIDRSRPPKQTLRLDNPANPLGYTDAVNQIRNIEKLIKENRLFEARGQLVPLRQWLIDCTEAHISLYNTLNKLPTARAQAELEKQLALEFAMLRDRAIFTLGSLYIEEKDYKKAVKELVEVIKSQPKSKVGILAYEMLQEIGFTEQLQLAPAEN